MISWAQIVKKVSALGNGREGKPIAWLVAFGVLYVSFFVVYFPLRGRYETISVQLNLRNKDIAQAKASGLAGLNLKEITRLQERVSRFRKSFIKISQAASVLDGISETAEAHDIQVISINSESPAALKDDAGQDFIGDGVRYSRLPVRIRLRGSVKSLADFLQEIGSSETFVFVIDEYDIKKTLPKSGLIDCDLVLSFFAHG